MDVLEQNVGMQGNGVNKVDGRKTSCTNMRMKV